MHGRRSFWTQRHWCRSARKVALILMFAAAAAPVWSDTRVARDSSESRKLCYCGCDREPGSPMCMHMCELAKYENRWWAASCHKKQSASPAPPEQQQQRSRSTKSNRVQEARR